MSINKSKNEKGERRKVEEKLETQKWRNKGASAYALRGSGVTSV